MTYFGAPLTKREQQVFDSYARGNRAKEIGRELGISNRTAEEHICNIRVKMGFGTQWYAALMKYHNATRVMVEGDL